MTTLVLCNNKLTFPKPTNHYIRSVCTPFLRAFSRHISSLSGKIFVTYLRFFLTLF